VFLYFRIYNIIIRFFDFYSIVKIAKAVFFSQLILIFINFYTYDKFFFPRSVSFIAPLAVGLLVVLSRIAFSFIVSNKNINYIKKNTLLYGIDNQVVLFSQNLRNSNSLFDIKGFIDHSNEFKKREVNGIKIYKKEDIINIIKEKKISYVFVGSNILNNEAYNNLLNHLHDCYVRINLIKPSYIENIQNTKDEPVDFYSVFNKKKNITNNKLLDKKINNKTILVTGAGGSIGSELCIQILKSSPKKLVLLENFKTKPDIQQVMSIDGFAEVSAKNYVDNYDLFFNFVKDLPITIIEKVESVKVGTDLEGKSFVFTGVRRSDLELIIESRGGKIGSGVSKNTSYLVMKAVGSGSSKENKAIELGVEVITVEQLETLLK
jgi:hypothetical protein